MPHPIIVPGQVIQLAYLLHGLLMRSVLMQNSLAYATRVRTIKNEVTKNEANKEILKLRKQLDYWKEQAGLSPAQRAYVDLEDIAMSALPPLTRTEGLLQHQGGVSCLLMRLPGSVMPWAPVCKDRSDS